MIFAPTDPVLAHDASTASRLSAAITAEALEDHFGAHSALESA